MIVSFIQLHYIIIAIGGILGTQNKLNVDTNLILVYTNLFYKGPQLIADCAQARKQDPPTEPSS